MVKSARTPRHLKRNTRKTKKARKSPPSPRILTLDIETAPLDVYTWGLYDQNVGLEQIHGEWTILAFSAKWKHERRVIYMDTGGRGPAKVRNDKPLLVALWKLLDDADIVVTQNGMSFDIKKINARLLMAGFKPYSPIKIIDTKLIAQRHFKLTSNKLKWMTEKLTKIKKYDHEKFPGFKLWAECLKDNPRAWAEMKKYNIIDTLSTEQLYLLKLRPWMVGHPNVAVYSNWAKMQCPKCGSFNVRKKGLWYTQSGEYQKIRCLDCGGWSRTRYTDNPLKKRQLLLSN